MRTLIVEDHAMMREVLVKICRCELRLHEVVQYSSGRCAIQAIAQSPPDLLIVDLHLPDFSGFAVIEAVRVLAPRSRIIVVSSRCDEYAVFRLLRAGVQGYVDKNVNTVATMKDAIARVCRSVAYFSPTFCAIQEKLDKDALSFTKVLTSREITVLNLVAVPFSDSEIACRLGISRATVERHRMNVLRKLRIGTTVELIRYATFRGFGACPAE